MVEVVGAIVTNTGAAVVLGTGAIVNWVDAGGRGVFVGWGSAGEVGCGADGSAGGGGGGGPLS